MNSKHIRQIGEDQVLLDVSKEDLERELANMEQLLEVLKININSNPKYSRRQKEIDCRELEETFDVAMTAMKMVWIQFEEGAKITIS